jgi:valyl-tRNA synthetase
MARDVVRQVQELRKTANLNMEDRIALVLRTDSATVQDAIQAHKDYIGNETLAVEWPASLDGDTATADVKIDGQPLAIRLRRVDSREPASKPGPKKAAPAAKPGKPKTRKKPAATTAAEKAPTRSKVKPTVAARSKATPARRRKSKSVQASAARKNAKSSRILKKAPKTKQPAKAKPGKPGRTNKGVKTTARRRRTGIAPSTISRPATSDA